MSTDRSPVSIPETHMPGWGYLNGPEQDYIRTASESARALALLALGDLRAVLELHQADSLRDRLGNYTLPALDELIRYARHIKTSLGEAEPPKTDSNSPLPLQEVTVATPPQDVAKTAPILDYELTAEAVVATPVAGQESVSVELVMADPAKAEISEAVQYPTAHHWKFFKDLFGDVLSARLHDEGMDFEHAQHIVSEVETLYRSITVRNPERALRRLRLWLEGKTDADIIVESGTDIKPMTLYLQRRSMVARLHDKYRHSDFQAIIDSTSPDTQIHEPQATRVSSAEPASASSRFEVTPLEELNVLIREFAERQGLSEPAQKALCYIVNPKYSMLRDGPEMSEARDSIYSYYCKYGQNTSRLTQLEHKVLELMLAINVPNGQKPLIARYIHNHLGAELPTPEDLTQLLKGIFTTFNDPTFSEH